MLGTQEPVRTAEVNEPSVFEPLKFYCSSKEGDNSDKKIKNIGLVLFDDGSIREISKFYQEQFLGYGMHEGCMYPQTDNPETMCPLQFFEVGAKIEVANLLMKTLTQVY